MLNRKRLTFVVLILLIIVSVRFLPGCGQGLNILTDISSGGAGTGVDWSQWTYRRSITISNGVTAQTDYQVNIQLNNINFVFANADPDGDDIRFNLSGVSLKYWIESWDSIGETASVWVKVPSIAAFEDIVIYLYYGNAGLTDASDFDNTFTKDSGFPGLTAQWHMDEGSGSSLADSSGNSNTGTITDALWAGADGGKWFDRTDVNFSTGKSIIFDGNDYIVISDNVNDTLDPLQITVSFWFKPGVVGSGYFVSKWNTDPNNRAYSVYLNGGKVSFDTSSDGISFNPLIGGTTVIVGTWYHVTVVYDGVSLNKRIYLNGVLDGTTGAASGALFNSNLDLTIGTLKVGGGNYYTGEIDEISIYNIVLTADQIKALSQRRKDSPDMGDTPVVGEEEAVP